MIKIEKLTDEPTTRQFYLAMRDILSPVVLEECFPHCFHNEDSLPSMKVYREIFWKGSKRTILDCWFVDLVALVEVTGIPASTLHFEYGIGQNRITTNQLNSLLRLEGAVAGAITHSA
jgi:hypothetical protein